MVNTCANPECAKPLHYLREGRVFIFEVATEDSGANGKKLRRLEHFWLCGGCSQTMTVMQEGDGIKVVRRLPAIYEPDDWEGPTRPAV
jgi:hypothetical protein